MRCVFEHLCEWACVFKCGSRTVYETAFVTVFEGKCVGVSECMTASVHKFQCA